jgi:hypothetical protein
MKDRRRRRLSRRSPACRFFWLCGVVVLSTWAAFGLPDDHNDEAPEVRGVEDAVTTPTPTSADAEEAASPPTMPTTLQQQQQQQQAPMVWPAEPSPIDDAVESLARRAGTTATDTIVMHHDADNDDTERLSSVPTVWPESNPSVVADANTKDDDDNDDTEARRSSLPPVPTFWPADAPVVHDNDDKDDDKEATRPPVPTVWPEEAPVAVVDDGEASGPPVPTVWPEEAPAVAVVDNDKASGPPVPTVWPEEAPVAVVDNDKASGPPVPTVWPEEAPAVVANDKTSLPPLVPKEAAAAVARPPTDDDDDATIDLDEEEDATTEETDVPAQADKVAEPVAKAPPGSLAGFFVKLEEKKNNEGVPDMAATLAQVDTTAPDRVDETVPPPLQEEDTYWGIWGGRTYHKRADLSVLTLLFQDLLLQAQATVPGDELGTTMEDLLDASLTSTGLHADDITIPEAPQSHFLDGLDDLDKLFEDVDPPDELDISLGSSMQEILVGRGSQIVRKHVVKGLQALQQGLRQIRTAVTNKVTDEEGRLRLVSKEELVHAGQWLIQTAQRTYDTLQVFVDDLFEGSGEDETVADDDMLKEIQKRTGAS